MKFLKANILSYVLFITISLILTVIWFHGGYLIALGESVIPFYSLGNLFKFYGHVWTPISLGFYQTPVGSLPFFSYGLIFELFGFPNYVVQGIVFFTFLVLMFFGSHLLLRYLFANQKMQNKESSIIFGSFFYVFNLAALVSAWNRLQYPFILFYTSLPFILYLFFLGMQKKRYIYAIYLALLLIPFSMAFIAIPFLELLWGILGFYVLFSGLASKNRKNIIFAVTFLIICGIVWFFFNAWWLLQYFQYTLAVAHDVYSTSGNAQTLIILSNLQGNLSYIFRLMNRQLFLDMEKVWGSAYFIPWMTIVSYIIPFLAFMPLLKKNKPKIIYFFLALSLAIIFLAKGSSGPFGGVFLTLFTHIKLLEVFRSAFEKFSLVLPITYLPLIVFSVISLLAGKVLSARKRKYFILIITSVFLFVVLTFPFWNGWIFTYYIPHANNLSTGDYIKVPDYYKEANDYLNANASNFRTVVLPVESDSVTYNWSGHGFTGVDYTNGLFSKPFITLSFGVENLDSVVKQFQNVLFNTPKYFTLAMNLVDAKYLMIRKDIDYKYRATMNPEKVQQFILGQSIPNLSLDKQFGQLVFFRNNNYSSKIYAVSNIYSSSENGLWSDVFSLTDFKTNDVIFNSGFNKIQDNFIANNSELQLIYPNNTINYDQYPVAFYADGLRQVPQYYRFLPGSRLYRLILLKDKILLSATSSQEDRFFMMLDLTTQRLGELHKLILDKNYKDAVLAQMYYKDSISTFRDYSLKNISIVRNNMQYLRYKIESEKAVLDYLLSNTGNEDMSNKLSEVKSLLTTTNSLLGIDSRYADRLPSSDKAIVYDFDVPEDTAYEVLLRDNKIDNWYNMQLENIPVQINNNVSYVSPSSHDGFIDFGKYSLRKGFNEIQILLPKPKNLADGASGEIKTVLGSNKRVDLTAFDPNSSYDMKFEYKINRPADLNVRVNSDIDYSANGKTDTAGSLGIDTYGANNWTNFTFPFTPNNGSTELSLAFLLNPLSSCPRDESVPNYFKHCIEKKNTSQIDFQYKDLKIERVFTDKIILERNNASEKQLSGQPQISYKMINPSRYKIYIKGAENPFILVFSENFDFGWQLKFADSGKIISNDNHFLVNSYANAWYIEKKGTYILDLDYSSEDLYDIGKAISAVSIFLAAIVLMHERRKK